MVRLTRFFSSVLLWFVALLLIACQATVHEKGTILNPYTVAQIKVGQTTRAQVKELLGVPTIVSSLRKDRWAYVQDRQFKNVQRTFSRVINRVEITFDERGVVKEIQNNFDDVLLDPQTVPEAKNTQQWFAWLWGGEYMRPAIGGPPAAPVAAEEPKAPVGAPEESLEKRGGTHPWWRFWSSDKE
ncbi:MAG: outer membrane protein assembly factor BamE [Magnetococcales bacterium]|nr:outer membrane protein assembly factor BamE [Magnetococcales bacterium]